MDLYQREMKKGLEISGGNVYKQFEKFFSILVLLFVFPVLIGNSLIEMWIYISIKTIRFFSYLSHDTLSNQSPCECSH